MVAGCAECCFAIQEFKAEERRKKRKMPKPRFITELPANAIGFLITPDGPFGLWRAGDEEGRAYQIAAYDRWKRKQQESSTTPRPTTSEPETNPEPDHKDEAASRPENKRHSRWRIKSVPVPPPVPAHGPVRSAHGLVSLLPMGFCFVGVLRHRHTERQ